MAAYPSPGCPIPLELTFAQVRLQSTSKIVCGLPDIVSLQSGVDTLGHRFHLAHVRQPFPR